MLPIYEAIAFKEIIEKGSKTKPWLIFAQTELGVRPYVVKLFTPEQIQKRNSVQAEVLGNIMGKMLFDFAAPNAALINFSNSFSVQLPDEVQIILENRDDRIKFGTELITPHNPFYASLGKDIIESKIELDSLFAFDNLIRNRDRNNFKPNLILSKGDAYLIDHELGFERIEQALLDLKDGYWNVEFMEHHIFKSYLKNAVKDTKAAYFDTFDEYLRNIDVKQLTVYFRQLKNQGYVSTEDVIIPYLEYAKLNSRKFVNLLKGYLS